MQRKYPMRKVFFVFLKRMKITHLVFTGIQLLLLFAGIILAGRFSAILPDTEHRQFLRIVCLLALVTSFSSGQMFLRQHLYEIKDAEGIPQKLHTYSHFIFIRSCIWMISNLITFFCMLIQADVFVYTFAVLMIFLSNLHFPFQKQVLRDLKLSHREIHLLRETSSFA